MGPHLYVGSLLAPRHLGVLLPVILCSHPLGPLFVTWLFVCLSSFSEVLHVRISPASSILLWYAGDMDVV